MTITLDILKSPPAASREDLLNALVKAENQGDRHIKNLLKSPDLYSIRAGLVELFVRAFFGVLWDTADLHRDKLILDSLVGQASEAAFLEVRSNELCLEKHLSPLISPRKKINDEWKSLFLNHIDAAA